MIKTAAAALIAALLLAGCQSPAAPEPTPAPTAAPSPTATPDPTPSPTPSPTPAPAPTPTPDVILFSGSAEVFRPEGVYVGENLGEGWKALSRVRFGERFWREVRVSGDAVLYITDEWLLAMLADGEDYTLKPWAVISLSEMGGTKSPDDCIALSPDGCGLAVYFAETLMLVTSAGDVFAVSASGRDASLSVSPGGQSAALVADFTLTLLDAGGARTVSGALAASLGPDGTAAVQLGGERPESELVLCRVGPNALTVDSRHPMEEYSHLMAYDGVYAACWGQSGFFRLTAGGTPETLFTGGSYYVAGHAALEAFDHGSRAVNLSTGEQTLLAVSYEAMTAFSPDGKRALGIYVDDFGNLNMVWVADGADIYELTESFTDKTLYGVQYGAHFLPDGRLLILRHAVHRGGTSGATELEAEIIDWKADTARPLEVGR